MKHLVIGIGEVGGAVMTNLMALKHNVTTLDIKDEGVKGKFDVLHICFPYSDNFVDAVKKYKRKFVPDCIIIYSTVPIGTTKKIKGAVHSPVEGKHPRLDFGVKTFKRYIGYNDFVVGKMAAEVWEELDNYELFNNSDYTEFLKLASTSKYGINLVWAQYMADTAEKLGMDYALVKDWDRAYNTLYGRMGMGWAKKYVLDAPNGPIGGHCVTPNAELLDEQFPHEMLKMIKEMK